MKNTKELIGSKFLFDKSLISYADLVELLENEEFNVDFIKKPIKDNLEVHSLYIKPDYEVAYLVKNEKSDEHYKNAGYSCISYKEVTLQKVLDVLEYKVPAKEDIPEIQETKKKKSKFIIVTNDDKEYMIKKKNILYISYNERYKKIHFQFKNKCIEAFCITEEKYNEIKTELMS